MALLGAPAQRIGYFGPNSGGIVTLPPRPVDPPISMIPGLHGSPPPPIAAAPPSAPMPAANPGGGLNAHELAGLGLNGPAFNLWSNRHPAAVAAGRLPGWVQAAGRASRKNPLASAAAGAGSNIAAQGIHFPQISPLLRALVPNPGLER